MVGGCLDFVFGCALQGFEFLCRLLDFDLWFWGCVGCLRFCLLGVWVVCVCVVVPFGCLIVACALF